MKKLLLFVPALVCAGIITAVNASADGQPAAPAYRELVVHDGSAADLPIFTAPAPGTHEVAVEAANGDTFTVHGVTAARVDDRPILLAQADTAAAPSSPDAGSAGSASTPAVEPVADPLTELAALKLKYDALKAARDSGSKDLLWFAYAALAAAVIRTLLSGIKAWRGDKPTGWVKWTALALAVPLALLTYYAAGAGLWAAIVMAGAGPGAVIINELFKKKTAAS